MLGTDYFPLVLLAASSRLAQELMNFWLETTDERTTISRPALSTLALQKKLVAHNTENASHIAPKKTGDKL